MTEKTSPKSLTIYGIRTVMEAIKSEKNINKVFIQKGVRGALLNELMQLINSRKITVSHVPVERLNRFGAKNHQGVVAQLAAVDFYELADLVEKTLEKKVVPFFLLLDGITDARNFGAIIRTAECAGVHGIIIAGSRSAPVNADTVKTSAGAVFNIPICKTAHLKDAVYLLQASGIKIAAATEKSDRLIYDFELNQPLALIMGSEDRGITPALLKLADERLAIPLTGKTDSLNVSAACAAILFEVVRQRLL